MIQQYNDKILCTGNLERPLNPERAYFFRRMLEGLSAEGKEVVKIVLNTPGEMVEMVRAGKHRGINLSIITKYLRQKGWPIARIRKGITEIRQGLKEIEIE